MNRSQLQQTLSSMGIRADAYSLDGGHPSEAYVLAHDGRRWRVYYSERGQESDLAEFDDEAVACLHLLALLEADPTTRK
jgi:hypothetical protein